MQANTFVTDFVDPPGGEKHLTFRLYKFHKVWTAFLRYVVGQADRPTNALIAILCTLASGITRIVGTRELRQ